MIEMSRADDEKCRVKGKKGGGENLEGPQGEGEEGR